VSDAARVLENEPALPALIAASGSMKRAVHLAQRFATTSLPMLLVGPTGCGKELLAAHIHFWSGVAGTLVDVNCGALPRDLIESELFGHIKGAFSGATETRAGLVETADGGTLFLDEACSLPSDAQVKLLRVLDTGLVRRVGDTINRRVTFRLVAASQEQLRERAAAGTYRMDLLQRIAGVVIVLTALSERPDDISPLAEAFAVARCVTLEPSAHGALVGHSWPGNVRELRNVMERAAWLSETGRIGATEIREAMQLGAQIAGESRNDERELLVRVCEEECWNAATIARRLGLGRTTLYRRLLDLGISLQDEKRSHRLLRAVKRAQAIRSS
jgi:DNA-binding NtrC family response regulator